MYMLRLASVLLDIYFVSSSYYDIFKHESRKAEKNYLEGSSLFPFPTPKPYVYSPKGPRPTPEIRVKGKIGCKTRDSSKCSLAETLHYLSSEIDSNEIKHEEDSSMNSLQNVNEENKFFLETSEVPEFLIDQPAISDYVYNDYYNLASFPWFNASYTSSKPFPDFNHRETTQNQEEANNFIFDFGNDTERLFFNESNLENPSIDLSSRNIAGNLSHLIEDKNNTGNSSTINGSNDSTNITGNSTDNTNGKEPSKGTEGNSTELASSNTESLKNVTENVELKDESNYEKNNPKDSIEDAIGKGSLFDAKENSTENAIDTTPSKFVTENAKPKDE